MYRRSAVTLAQRVGSFVFRPARRRRVWADGSAIPTSRHLSDRTFDESSEAEPGDRTRACRRAAGGGTEAAGAAHLPEGTPTRRHDRGPPPADVLVAGTPPVECLFGRTFRPECAGMKIDSFSRPPDQIAVGERI